MLLFCLNCIKLKHMPEGPFQATLFSLYSSSFQTNLASLLLVNEKAPYQIFAYERIIAYTVHQLCKYLQHITEYLMSFRQSRYNHSYIIQNLKSIYPDWAYYTLIHRKCLRYVQILAVPCQKQQMALLGVLQVSGEHLWKEGQERCL